MSGTSDDRSVWIRWEDPGPLAQAAREMSGLDFLTKIARGELPWPPISKLLVYAHGTTTCLILAPERKA